MDNNAFSQMAAVLNGHQVTDEEGQIPVETETTEEVSTPEAQTTEPKTEPVEEKTEAPQAEAEPAEEAVDDSGNKYIPKKRFDQVYGEKKAAERKAEALEQQVQALMSQGMTRKEATTQAKEAKPDKTEALEIELLKGRMPEFDPESGQYSPELDQLGFEIFKANPGITRVEAARRAKSIAKKLTGQISEVKTEARVVKAQQSDQGITSHVTSRSGTQPNFDGMSDVEIEKYLKETGQW